MTSISRQCSFCGSFYTYRKVLKVGPSLPISDGYPSEEEIAASESDVYPTICWRYVERQGKAGGEGVRAGLGQGAVEVDCFLGRGERVLASAEIAQPVGEVSDRHRSIGDGGRIGIARGLLTKIGGKPFRQFGSSLTKDCRLMGQRVDEWNKLERVLFERRLATRWV